MPQIPRHKRQILSSANVGAAPASLDIANTGAGQIGQGIVAIGQGISNLGTSLARIKEADNKNRDLLAEARLSTAIKNAELNYADRTNKDGDVNNYAKYREESLSKLQADKDAIDWGSADARQRADIFAAGWGSTFTRKTEIGIVDKRSKEAITVTESQYITALSSLDQSETQEVITQRGEEAYREALAFKHGPDSIDLLIASAKSDGAKNRAISLAATGEYKEAREIINSATFDNPQDRAAALNSIRLMEAKEVDIAFERDLATNKGFVEDITSGSPDLPNSVQSSKLPDTSKDPDRIAKDDWVNWIDGSFSPLPEETTPAASGAVIESIINHSKNKINTEKAMKDVLDVMYSDRELTEVDYEWALKRLENPYSAQIASDLGRITEENKETARFFFTSNKFDQLRIKKVNSGLITFIEDELEKGNTVTYDQMYQESARLRTGVPVEVEELKPLTEEEWDERAELIRKANK